MNSRARKQGDQSEEQGGKNRDPALTVKSQYHRSQPQPPTKNNTPVPRLVATCRPVAAGCPPPLPVGHKLSKGRAGTPSRRTLQGKSDSPT